MKWNEPEKLNLGRKNSRQDAMIAKLYFDLSQTEPVAALGFQQRGPSVLRSRFPSMERVKRKKHVRRTVSFKPIMRSWPILIGPTNEPCVHRKEFNSSALSRCSFSLLGKRPVIEQHVCLFLCLLPCLLLWFLEMTGGFVCLFVCLFFCCCFFFLLGVNNAVMIWGSDGQCQGEHDALSLCRRCRWMWLCRRRYQTWTCPTI